MFKFRVFLTAFLLIAALFSVQSEAASVKHDLNLDTVSQISPTSFADLTKAPLIAKKMSDGQHKKNHQTDYWAHQPRFTANNSSLFLYNEQSEPQYDVIFEFFAHTITEQIYLQSQPVNKPKPWYTLVSKSKKSRLSGWKDANLLYTAVTTYHA